jgi:hypothetical protein
VIDGVMLRVEHHHFEPPRLRELFGTQRRKSSRPYASPLTSSTRPSRSFGQKAPFARRWLGDFVALLSRMWQRDRPPGVVFPGTVGLTARSVIALDGSSSLLGYFLQPSLGTALLGATFLLSVPLGCPLAETLAHYFVPLPPFFFRRQKVRQLLVRTSLLWAPVSLLHAASRLALLVKVPDAAFLAAKTGYSSSLTLVEIVLSSRWFRLSVHRHHTEPLPVPAQ